MSFEETFYGNESKRETVVRLCSTIHSCMKNNFIAINELIKAMRERVGIVIVPVTLIESETIEQNAKKLVTKIKEVQAHFTGKLGKYGRTLDPHMYKELLDDQIDIEDKYRQMKMNMKRFDFALGCLVTVATVSSSISLLLAGLKVFLGPVGLAAVGLGLLVTGVDIIVSAIVGKQEKDSLESAIHTLESILDKFKPSTEKYAKDVQRVMFNLEKLDKIAEEMLDKQNKMLLRKINAWIRKRENTITTLRCLAAKLDETSKDCNIAKLTGTSTSVISGFIGIGTLIAVPFTGGLSLIGTAACAATGIAGGGTVIGTEIAKKFIEGGLVEKAEDSIKEDKDVTERMDELMKSILESSNAESAVSLHALDVVGIVGISGKAGAIVTRLSAKAGATFITGAGKAVGVVGEVAKFAGPIITVAFLPIDIVSLITTSIDTHNGSVNAAADAIRERIKDLEAQLKDVGSTCFINWPNVRDSSGFYLTTQC